MSSTALSLGFSMAALAQVRDTKPTENQSPSDEAGVAENKEIIVTAQKRTERLNEVPISISVISQDAIEKSGATTLKDIQYTVPGLSLVNFSSGGQQFQLRGISANQGRPTVGVYLDEMPVTSDSANSNIELDLMDLERVEVLRGPQGDLYGEGAMGGTIRYVTASPNLSRYEGSIGAKVSAIQNGDPSWRLEGVVAAPIVEDQLGIRLSGSYERSGGWIDNGTTGESDTNSAKRWNVRAKVAWEPTASTKVGLLYIHSDTDSRSNSYSLSDRQSQSALLSPNNERYNLFNLLINHEFGAINLLSSTGYISRKSFGQTDFTRILKPFLETPPPFGFGFPSGTFTGVGLKADTDFETLTEEVRLSSNGPRFGWTFGGYYRDNREHQISTTFELPAPAGFTLFATNKKSVSKSWAAFGQVYYNITDALKFTVGGRYFEDRRSQLASSTSFGVSANDLNGDTFKTFNPKLSLNYQFGSSSSIYASAAKGFRSGGFNLKSAGRGVVTIPPSYDPEQLWTYEIGGVLSLPSKVFVLQWAAYRNEWTDIQTLNFVPGSIISVTQNGGKASGFGVEIQGILRPIPSLELEASFGWNNMKYDTTTLEKRAGDPVDYVPPVTASISAMYKFEISHAVSGFIRAQGQYTDPFRVTIRNSLPAPISSQARTAVQLSVGASMDNWEVRAYVDNILDNDKVEFPAFGSISEPIRTRPRSIGLSVNRAF
jgi:outer membrane receptor protein involved in Fe transport